MALTHFLPLTSLQSGFTGFGRKREAGPWVPTAASAASQVCAWSRKLSPRQRQGGARSGSGTSGDAAPRSRCHHWTGRMARGRRPASLSRASRRHLVLRTATPKTVLGPQAPLGRRPGPARPGRRWESARAGLLPGPVRSPRGPVLTARVARRRSRIHAPARPALGTRLLLRPENILTRTCSRRRFQCASSRKNKLFSKTKTQNQPRQRKGLG